MIQQESYLKVADNTCAQDANALDLLGAGIIGNLQIRL